MTVLPFNKLYQENGIVWSKVQSDDPENLLVKETLDFIFIIYSWSKVTCKFPKSL